MIKVKVNNEYKDVVKIFCGGTLQKEIIKVWSREAQEYVYESSVEYTGTLPIAITANGDALLDYRIYGADGGVGVATENLYNKNDPDIVLSAYIDYSGTIRTGKYGNAVKVSGYIPINGGQTYTGTNLMDTGHGNHYSYYDANKQLLEVELVANNMVFNSPINAAYIRTTLIHRKSNDIAMVTKGSTAPADYIPYGYKLPMTVGDGNTAQNVPVYIGENQLDEGEYVSYGEQKIYKRTENLFPSAVAQTQVVNGVTATCDGNGRYSFFGTATKPASIFFIIPKFIYPDVSITDFIVSFFNSPGVDATCLISDRPIVGLEMANRVFRNSIRFSYFSGQETSRVHFNLKAGTTYNFTMSPMVVLGTVAPSQFVPHIVPTDPPVPLPEIPTIDGTTVIDYDGDPKPSQMYVKYRR